MFDKSIFKALLIFDNKSYFKYVLHILLTFKFFTYFFYRVLCLEEVF